MISFTGMPFRNMLTLVPGEDGRRTEKRITRVARVSDVIEVETVRTTLVQVFFDDGSSRMGCVTL